MPNPYFGLQDVAFRLFPERFRTPSYPQTPPDEPTVVEEPDVIQPEGPERPRTYPFNPMNIIRNYPDVGRGETAAPPPAPAEETPAPALSKAAPSLWSASGQTMPWTSEVASPTATTGETKLVSQTRDQDILQGPGGTRGISLTGAEPSMANPPTGTAAWTPALANAAPTARALAMGLAPGQGPGTYNSETGIFTSRAQAETEATKRGTALGLQDVAAERAAAPRRQAMQNLENYLLREESSGDPKRIAGAFALREAFQKSLGPITNLPAGAAAIQGGRVIGVNPPLPRTDITPPATAYAPEAVAKELFPNIPYGQLSREQVETVNRESEKRQIRTGGQTTGARVAETIKAQAANLDDIRRIATARSAGMTEGRIAPDVHMSPSALQAFGLPFGSTWKDAMGMISSSPKARLAVEELKVSTNLLEALGGYADKLITAKDWQSAATQGATLWTGAFTRSNADAAVFADQREALLGVFSRQIGAERGVLTDRDIYRIDKALPNFRDTKQVKDMKMTLLRSMIQVNREARTKSISTWLDSDVDLTTGTEPGGPPPSTGGPPATGKANLPDLRKKYGY